MVRSRTYLDRHLRDVYQKEEHFLDKLDRSFEKKRNKAVILNFHPTPSPVQTSQNASPVVPPPQANLSTDPKLFQKGSDIRTCRVLRKLKIKRRDIPDLKPEPEILPGLTHFVATFLTPILRVCFGNLSLSSFMVNNQALAFSSRRSVLTAELSTVAQGSRPVPHLPTQKNNQWHAIQ